VAAAQSDGDGVGNDTDDAPLEGEALDKASAAAIEEAGGGQVTEAEAEDDGETGYEVEVTLDDGSEVDVQLDDAFAVVSSHNDGPDDDGPDDDADDANDVDDDGPNDD